MVAPECKLCSGPTVFICSNPNTHCAIRTIHTFRCLECGCVFVGNTVTIEDLIVAYSREGSDAYYQEIRRVNHKKYTTACGAVRHLLPDNFYGEILDVGCGNGEFAGLLARSGFKRIAVHEFPGVNLDHLREMGIAVFQDFTLDAVPSNSFDLITLLDVAEHALDPGQLFRQCARILRPGGQIYFHTPVVSRLDKFTQALCGWPTGRCVGRIWQRGRVNIFHLQNFTNLALNRLLTIAGFEAVTINERNELSWPIRCYVTVNLCEKANLPGWLATVLTPFLFPVLTSEALNRNKAIVFARRT